jgi:cytoskeleton protein RodZ
MNTTVAMDEVQSDEYEKPGLQLARLREKKGYSQEYIAGKLHLRVRLIELLESDSYHQMPEPVFVKGYLRAYAKLLGVAPEPFLASYNSAHDSERKIEKALWQGRRESHRGERFVRWLTALIVLAAIVAVGMWWQKNRESEQLLSKTSPTDVRTTKFDSEMNLTDISKMQIFSTTPPSQLSPLESRGG